MNHQNDPVACATMLIRKPVAEVFEAFVDPALTSRFWFTRGSGRVEEGAVLQWHWDPYGASAKVLVKAVEPDRRILIEWPTPVEWSFRPREDDTTFVRITAGGFTGSPSDKIGRALDSMGGFSFLLAGCKAFLEHGIELKLVEDHDPDAHARSWTQRRDASDVCPPEGPGG